MGASQQQGRQTINRWSLLKRFSAALVYWLVLRGSLGGVSGCGKDRLVFIPAIRSPARVRAPELSRNVCCRVGRPLTELVMQATRSLDERDNQNYNSVRSIVLPYRLFSQLGCLAQSLDH